MYQKNLFYDTDCGGQIQTLQSLGTMIVNIRKLLKEKHFELYDVYPDGNCMLRSIVDQLRVRGNFRYTNFSLRTAAVDYLRRNPNAVSHQAYVCIPIWTTFTLQYIYDTVLTLVWNDYA